MIEDVLQEEARLREEKAGDEVRALMRAAGVPEGCLIEADALGEDMARAGGAVDLETLRTACAKSLRGTEAAAEGVNAHGRRLWAISEALGDRPLLPSEMEADGLDEDDQKALDACRRLWNSWEGRGAPAATVAEIAQAAGLDEHTCYYSLLHLKAATALFPTRGGGTWYAPMLNAVFLAHEWMEPDAGAGTRKSEIAVCLLSRPGAVPTLADF